MGLFSKVKMRRNRVFKKMDDRIARQDQRRGPSHGETKALGNHLQKGSRHHEAGAQCDKVAQIALRHIGANQYNAAEYVSERGKASEDEREREVGHKNGRQKLRK